MYLVCVHLLSVCVSVYVSVCVYVCMCVCMYVCAMCVRCDVLLFVLVCFLKVGFLSYTLTQLHRVVLLCIEHMRLHYLPIRPVGWSGDGGVRETMRVELTSGGGAFPGVWGSAISSPIGVWGGAPAALQLLQC